MSSHLVVLPGSFWTLNNVFLARHSQTIDGVIFDGNVFLEKTFPIGYHVPKMKIVCKSYDPREVNVLTYPNGSHMTFGV
jgi:hypothetical protein